MTELHFAETPSGRIAYTRRGTGDPLLLIMGVAGHHGMWGNDFIESLAGSFDVVAFDHRGIGESVWSDERFTIPDLADDAAALMDHLGWDAAHVMGISMGGTVAQELALRHRPRVRRLVLGCTWAGAGSEPGHQVWGPSVSKLAQAAGGGDPIAAARLMFEANFSPSYAARPGRFKEFVEAAATATVPGPVVLAQMEAASVHDAVHGLERLDMLTLVMHGSEDQVILPAAGQRLAGLIRDASWVSFDGAGHLFFWEQPQRAAALVTAHLSS